MKTNRIHLISFKSFFFAIMFLGIGICLIVLPKTFSRRMENWIQTTGTIIKIEEISSRSKCAIVEYYVEEERITGEGDLFISTYKVGDEVEVKYNPNNHNEFTLDVSFKMTTIPFVVTGSILIAISVAITSSQIVKGTSAKKKFVENTSQLNLNYIPSFMLEYAPLRVENKESYKFKQQLNDFNNYEVTNSKGEVMFYTKRIKKGFTSNATYQLIDSTTKQTTLVNIKKTSNAGKSTKGGLKIKVDNLPIDKYFETRHVTYDVSKEGNATKYTLFNNGSTIGFVYQQGSHSNSFDIETAKENIDDISLFVLCLTFR